MSTPEEDLEAISTALTNALAGPRRVRGDAGEVESHDIDQLIKAHEYLKGQVAGGSGTSNARRGLRFTRLIPPGSV